MMSIAVQTAVVDVLASGEFCNSGAASPTCSACTASSSTWSPPRSWCSPIRRAPRRRPTCWPILWYIGALMVCLGGYWFWFFIRVDVAAEGNSPFRLDARRSVRRLAGRERDVRPDLGLAADGGQYRWAYGLPRPLPHRHDGAVRRRFRGRSSRTCSSSRPRRSRKEYPRPMARPRTCRR